MPNSDDQSVDMPTSADPVRQREPDPIVAQLRERMERLPHGHPSSPYNDDGSRKPPPPDLSQYELPIPGDPDYRPESSGVSEADGPEAGQTSEHVTPGTSPDEGPETTTDRRELWEAPPDVEPPADAEYTEHAQEVRERPDQVWSWGLAPDEEDTPGVRDEASQEEREALHEAPANDLDERAANELPLPNDDDYESEPSRASEAEGPTDEGSASAGDRQNADDKAAADEPAPDSVADRPSDSEAEPSSGPDHEPPSADQEGFSDLDSQEQAEHRLSQITDRAIERCLAAEGRDAEGNYGEHGLTPAMRRIESQLDYGHLADQTEKYALKDPARFKGKLAERIERFPNADPNDLAAEIHDGVRYTLILDFDHYTDGVGIAQSELAQAGYDQIETKPGWRGEEYKGVNSQWEDPASGIRFEVQFHTSESWSAKQITHESYEAIRSNKVSVKEVESLRTYQREVSATVRIPLGALDIPAYKKGRLRRR
jgi:hypothetical protein